MSELAKILGAYAPVSHLRRYEGLNVLTGLSASLRSRGEWNERFTHWERSESDTETQRMERARGMVRDALLSNEWLKGKKVVLADQGSFTNRTNTRLDSDIDLRVQHPDLRLDYRYGVDPTWAYSAGGYSGTGRLFTALLQEMRSEITASLRQRFGWFAVDDTGKKAIRVNGLEGSRAEVDVVPCFTLHSITGTTILGNNIDTGIAILGTDGNWTHNYPDQHLANGRKKRVDTSFQFKRVVRIVKRLQADMIANYIINTKVASFLIECIIYNVEDKYFGVDGDDRYGRVKRVMERARDLISGGLATYALTEVNEINPLFMGPHGWTLKDAQDFVSTTLNYLGNK